MPPAAPLGDNIKCMDNFVRRLKTSSHGHVAWLPHRAAIDYHGMACCTQRSFVCIVPNPSVYLLPYWDCVGDKLCDIPNWVEKKPN